MFIRGEGSAANPEPVRHTLELPDLFRIRDGPRGRSLSSASGRAGDDFWEKKEKSRGIESNNKAILRANRLTLSERISFYVRVNRPLWQKDQSAKTDDPQ